MTGEQELEHIIHEVEEMEHHMDEELRQLRMRARGLHEANDLIKLISLDNLSGPPHLAGMV